MTARGLLVLALALLVPGLARAQTGTDPDLWREIKLLASDGAERDYFGHSVSVSGDTALVGALNDDENGTNSGSAYVFVRSGGVWTEQAKLLASDGAAEEWFGYSVSLSGDTALVGALWDDDNGESSGSAYVFVRKGGVWTEQAKLLASDGWGGAQFGRSVSLSGDTALVGTDEYNFWFPVYGSAYVFVRSDGVWTEQAKLLASDGAAEDGFGFSVSLSEDTALVGAPRDGPGSAYVFVRSGGAWTEQAKLLASDGAGSDRFGWSVSLSGDTALVGAYRDNDNGSESGSAYVFARSGGIWTEQAKLLPSDGAADDEFGGSVSLSGETALVGARLHDDNGSGSGSAYVFARSGYVWTEQYKLLASDGAAGDEFGTSVSLWEDTALVGASGDDDNGNASGSAYVFGLTLSLYCFSLDNFCDGIEITDVAPDKEITDVAPDKTVAATWRNWDCAGATSPMLGGYSGKNVSPRLSWLAGDPLATLDTFSFNLNVGASTFDLFKHDTAFNLTQYWDDEPYTQTQGRCLFGLEKAGLPSSMEALGSVPAQGRTKSVEASPFGPYVTFPFCIDFDNSVDGIEVSAIQADEMIVATWENHDDGGSVAPMLGGFAKGAPRRAYIMSDIGVLAPGDIFVFTFEADLGRYDLWSQDAAGNVTLVEDDQPYTITNGTCPF